MPQSPTEKEILAALETVKYPGFSRHIVSFGLVKEIQADHGEVLVRMKLATTDPRVPATIQQESEAALRKVPGVANARVIIDIDQPTQGAAPGTMSGTEQIPGVRHVIAVASGKGGVGKSTVAANLAVALSRHGKTGLCDTDIYGPSVALMFGSRDPALPADDNRILPVEQYGIRLMSMGLLVEDDQPAILRGPMVTSITRQFLRQVVWGELDYLVLDLPPGTGDVQLTIVQTVTLAGAVIVTTPQEVALIDARKAAGMFAKVNVPVLGLVENMSYFQCPEGDGTRHAIFGEGGGVREAARLGVPLLGQIPIDIATREAGDRGRPIVLEQPQNPVAQAFEAAATALTRRLD